MVNGIIYTRTRPNTTLVRQARYYTVAWGGYVKEPTDAEIQAELDQMQEDWNNARTRRGWQRPIFMGKLKLGERTRYKREKFTCDKEVKLWSKFEFNRIPGDTSANPRQLQTPGDRPKYVTSLSYIAREAGYNGNIVTKAPQSGNDEFIEYPKPRSYNYHSYMPHDLDSIEWENFQIIGDPVWTGSATRYFNSKSAKWCKRHNQKYEFACRVSLFCKYKKRYEYKLFQNESVEEPSS